MLTHAEVNHAFPCWLLCLPHLQVLAMNLSVCAILSSSVHLSKLSSLTVHLGLSRDVDHAWLRVQPVRELKLVIDLNSAEQQLHDSLITQLQPLQLTHVEMYLCSPLPQDIAAGCAAVQANRLQVVFHTTLSIVIVLPSICSDLYSFISFLHDFDSAACGGYCNASWALLICWPGKKLLELTDSDGCCPGLQAIGCDAQSTRNPGLMAAFQTQHRAAQACTSRPVPACEKAYLPLPPTWM